jgi:hypothetical protein
MLSGKEKSLPKLIIIETRMRVGTVPRNNQGDFHSFALHGPLQWGPDISHVKLFRDMGQKITISARRAIRMYY